MSGSHKPKTLAVVLAAIGLSVGPLATHPAIADDPDYTTVLQTLDQEIPQMMAEDGTVGLTIAIVDGQDVIAAKGYGYADRAAKKPVTADTLFHIGSVSKTFTATAVMQLVEQGKVRLDAPLSRYVPEFSMLPRYKGNVITVRSVMDHHSGIPGDVFNGLITNNQPDRKFRRWLLKALAKMRPERRVNTMSAYNNSGVVLLQNLVENVTGEKFDAYTAKHLFAPMGMPRSTYNDRTPSDEDLTGNYMARSKDDVRSRPREYVNGWSTGSIVSSANEMANYLRMLNAEGHGVNSRVLKAKTLQQMLTEQTDLPLDISTARNGLAWFLFPDTWMGFLYMHNGATIYNFTMLQALRDSDLAVFVSANTATPTFLPGQVANRALTLMYTAKTNIEPLPPQDLPVKPSDPPTKAFVGKQAGVWAKTSGYDLVAAQGKRLKVITDAHGGGGTAATYRRMRGGWWASKAQPGQQIQLRTVQGRRLMIARTPGTSGITEHVVAQRASQASISKQWRERFGTYRAANKVPNLSPGMVPAKVRLRQRHGVLTLDRGLSGVEVLQPIKPDVAYSFGMGPGLGRNKGDGLFVRGKKLVFMGVVYRPV